MDSIKDRAKKHFIDAVHSLASALSLSDIPEDVLRDAVLLRFELASELMPKVLRRILSERGADVVLPKDVVRDARAGGIIDETIASVLLQVIDDRNRMVHDYSEEYADSLYERIKERFAPALQSLTETLK